MADDCSERAKHNILLFVFLLITKVHGYQQFFRIRPTDTTVVKASDLELQCNIANQAGSVQWSKDGFLLGFNAEIPGFPRYSMNGDSLKGVYNLRIKDIQLEDEGDYQCQVGPAENQKPIRAGAKVTVLVPPLEVLIASTTQIIRESFNATTPNNTFKASNAVPSRVKQKHSNNHHRYHGHHRHNDRQRYLSSDDNTVFAVMKVREAERVTFECNTSSLTKPETQLLWYKGDTLLKEDSYSVYIKSGLGLNGKLSSTKSVLTIYVKLDDNAAKYSCKAIHPALTQPLINSVFLSVLQPPGIPRIEGYRSGDTISVGDTLTLGCISRGGNPPAKLIWYKDNVTIDTSYESTDGREVTNTYSMLVKPNDNNAHFICEASNEVSVVPFTSSVRLTVFYPPSNIKIIGADKARVGETLTFECVVGPSNPASEVSWVIDGRPTLPIASWTRSVREGWITATNISITVNSLDPDSKSISCYAASETLRDTILQTVNLQILYPPGIPTIIGFKEGVYLREGDLQRLQCVSLGGNPFATLKWFRGSGNDREISGLTSVSGSGVSSELIIRVKSSDNEATYRCEASNAATSEPLTVSVKLRVYFVSSLINIKTKPKFPKDADKVTLIAETESCNPTCSVKCNRNGIHLQHHSENAFEAQHFGKTTKATFEFTVSPKDDNSLVICEGSNKLNKTIKQRHTIRVLYKPQFSVPLFQKYDVIEDTDVLINLTAHGFPSLINYTWLKSGIPIIDTSSDSFEEASNNNSIHLRHNRNHKMISLQSRTTIKGATFKISNIQRYDADEYECEASNSEGTTKTSIVINVLFSASIIKSSEMVFTNIGDEAVITCEAIGNPINEQTIVWRRNDSLENISNRVSRIAIKNEKGKSILNISRVNIADLGFYKCVAFNGIGRPNEALINLLLKQRPQIIETSAFAAANEHETLIIKCTARGVPLVKFSWFNSDGDLFLSSREDSSKEHIEKRNVQYSVSSHQLTDFKFQSWLTIKDVNAAEFGSKFKCSAFNALGRDLIEITVREKGRPEPPQNVTLTAIDHNSVTISLIPGFDGGVQQTFRAKYRKVVTNPEQDHYQITEESNSTRITINGLEQATEYVLTVISKNDFGESNLASNSLRFTTKFADASSDGSPLIDTYSDEQSKSLSKIALMIAVIALGLVIALTNCAFIYIYIKRKKKKEEKKSVQYCENSNGVVASNQNQIHSETHNCKSLETVDLTRTEFNECHLSAEMNAQQFEFITSSLIIETDVNVGSKHCKVVSFHEDIDDECGCYLKSVADTSF